MFYLKRVISFDSLEKCSKFKKRKEKKKAIFCLVILLSKVIASMASKVNFQDKEKNRRIFPIFWGEKKEEWNDSKFMPHLWPHHSASLTFCGHLTKTFLGVLSNSFKLQLNYALHEFLLFVPKMKRGPFFSKAAKDTLQTPACSFTGFIVGQIDSKSLKNCLASEADRGQIKYLLLENF